MKTAIKALGLAISVSALALSGTLKPQASTKDLSGPTSAVQLPYEEVNAFADGAKWVSGSTQCDGSRNITILKPIGTSNSIHLMSFPKSEPARRSEITMRQKGDPDCGMMKCYSTYLASSGLRYVIMDSNYRDEDAYWLHAVMVGKGKDAEGKLDECRWIERTRVAIVTELRTIYITQNEAGGLEYKTFNYKGAAADPSVTVKDGKSRLDRAKGIESFTFTNGDYAYEVTVGISEKKPLAEVLVKKNGATIQTEDCLAYSYARKAATTQ
jgi:hypothetical protein